MHALRCVSVQFIEMKPCAIESTNCQVDFWLLSENGMIWVLLMSLSFKHADWTWKCRTTLNSRNRLYSSQWSRQFELLNTQMTIFGGLLITLTVSKYVMDGVRWYQVWGEMVAQYPINSKHKLAISATLRKIITAKTITRPNLVYFYLSPSQKDIKWAFRTNS